MTIKELKEFYDNDEEYFNVCIKLHKMYGHIVPKLNQGDVTDHAEFWSSILDCISDDEVQKIIFVIIMELVFYEKFQFIQDAMPDDLEYMDKVLTSMIDKVGNVMDLRFLPGDYIQKPGSAPEKVVSITIGEDLKPRIHTERKKLIRDVYTYKDIIEEDEFDNYKEVDEPEMYCERNEYGEYEEPYWDY